MKCESLSGVWIGRGWVQERVELAPDDLKRLVVLEQGLVNFRPALQDTKRGAGRA